MKTTEELWKQYEEKTFVISSYELMLSTAYFDADTIAPEKGADYRNSRMAYLEGEAFSLQTDPEYIGIIEELSRRNDLTEQQNLIIKWQLRDLDRIRNIPKDLYVEMSRHQMDSIIVWKKAKASNDYASFKPYLLKTIELIKETLKYRKSPYQGYDILLDDYEPDMTMEKYDRFFDLIREKLVPLIRKVQQAEQISTEFVNRSYPVGKQREFNEKLLDYLQFDRDAGVVSETEHPFTNALSKNDVRVTTHYYEDNLLSSIFSIIHETGHATYNYQVADELAETYLFDNMSSGMHESQSRLMENYLGRNPAFWDNLFPALKAIFPQQLADVDQQQFVRAANASVASLIRTEADELTYPLHILIRYEMEKAIFNETIDLERLNEIWADKYEEYLGVRPQSDTEGILQDVHWPQGSFGYFPTYALGSGYAAQFIAAMRKDLDIEKCLSENRMDLIKEWLKEHIHKFGGTYSPQQQIIIATGEPFDPNYYVDYLTDKYSRLYNLK